jgi:hypothetical protein
MATFPLKSAMTSISVEIAVSLSVADIVRTLSWMENKKPSMIAEEGFEEMVPTAICNCLSNSEEDMLNFILFSLV